MQRARKYIKPLLDVRGDKDMIIINSHKGGSGILVPEGLVAYYPFNSNANDESGNGYNGTVNGATLTTDRNGNSNSAYEVGNLTKYITLPINFNGQTAYSVSLWVYTASAGIYPGIFCTGTTFTQRKPWVFVNPDGGDNFEHNLTISGTKSNAGANIYLRDTWKHVVIIYDNVYMYLYVDGSLSGTPTAVTGAISDAGITYIGKDVSNNVYMGTGSKVDDIRIYNRVLTTDEITALYNE